MEKVFQQVLFNLNKVEINLGQIIIIAIITAATAVVLYYFRKWFVQKLKDSSTNKFVLKKLSVQSFLLIFLTGLFSFSAVCKIDLPIYAFSESSELTVRTIVEIFLLIILASFLTSILSKLFIRNYYLKTEQEAYSNGLEYETTSTKAGKLIQKLVYSSVILYFINLSDLNFELFAYKSFSLDLVSIVIVVIVIYAVQLLYWLIIHVFMYNYYRKKEIDIGSQYAINQIIKYVLYILSFFAILDLFGQNLTVIWGGLAALLVGIGLGLQQTFNDFFSGFVLLFERSVVVGNIIDVDGKIGRVMKIGLRTSTLQGRDGISLIVPNSKITTHNVVNWDHDNDRTRFDISVRATFGSDTALIRKLICEAAIEHPDVTDELEPFVRLENFGEFALEFKLYFWSYNLFFIENVQSDIRFSIDEKFRKNGITIPIPHSNVNISGIDN